MDLRRCGQKPPAAPPQAPASTLRSVQELCRFASQRGWVLERDPRGWLALRRKDC